MITPEAVRYSDFADWASAVEKWVNMRRGLIAIFIMIRMVVRLKLRSVFKK